MLKKYLLSSVARIPDDETGNGEGGEKSAVDKQRESIKVESTNKTQEQLDAEAKEAADKEAGDKEKEAETGEETGEGDEETEGEETEGNEEKTPEQLAAEKEAARTKTEKARIQKRIDKEVAKRKAAETELAELKAKVEASGEGSLTPEEADKLAEEKAKQIVAMREFEKACDSLFKAAIKIDKDFKEKIDALADDIGAIPGAIIGVLSDFDNGGKVLTYLADNPDEAEKIWEMSPMKAAVELTKLSAKLVTPKKVVSKVPPPNDPLKGSGRTTTDAPLNDKMSTKDWIEKRKRDVEEKRKAGRTNLY